MWDESKIREYLRNVLKESRYKHVMGVVKVAEELAVINKVEVDKCRIAALCHDIAKNMSNKELFHIIEEHKIELTVEEEETPELWHSIVAPIVTKDILGIDDQEILSAVRWHTTGKMNMSTMDKIIYIADMIEPSRNFPKVESIREITYRDLDEGILAGINHTIKYLIDNNAYIDRNTIEARTSILMKMKRNL